jgi:predicted phosphoribosyltransferase
VPVAPPGTIAELRSEADEIVCLEQPDAFHAIGAYYLDFRQVTDEQVAKLLTQFPIKKADMPQASKSEEVAKA